MSSEEKKHHHTQEALNHLRLVIQNLQMIEAMVRDEKPCTDVVRRLSGALVTLVECRSIIARDHIASCIHSALKPGQEKVVNEVSILFQELLKGPLQGSHH